MLSHSARTRLPQPCGQPADTVLNDYPATARKYCSANFVIRNGPRRNRPEQGSNNHQQSLGPLPQMPFDSADAYRHNLKDHPVTPAERGGQSAGTRSLQVSLGVMRMAGQLHTPAEAARILRVRESWLKTKAAARVIPCTFIGKHLRFSDDDIAAIMKPGAASLSSPASPGPTPEPPDRPAPYRESTWRTRRSGGKARHRGG